MTAREVMEIRNAFRQDKTVDIDPKAIGVCIDNALNKQIPQKPNIYGDGYDDDGNLIYDTYDCPNCQTSYEIEYEKYNYCPSCGQALDWGLSGTNDWIETRVQLPPENQIVQTKIDDGKGIRNETELIYSKGCWWFPDKSMYVYYVPTHWRFVD